jgi:hypothetical protein
MNSLRAISSLFLLLLAAITLPFALYGAVMSAFGPGSYNPRSPIIISIEIAIVTILPAVAIWIPHKAALIVGGIALLLPTFLAVCLLWAAPPAGIIGVIPLALWYFSAVKCWQHLSL